MEFVSYAIASNDFRRAGSASRAIKEHLKRIGADAEAIRRTMIAAYEAEMNVVIHSVGGRLEASLTDSQIDVNVVDDGPGIPDVEQAMVEGFSTASAEARALGFGAGMGLPNIKRNSDRLRVLSRAGEGTRVSFTVYLQPEHTAAGRLTSLYASADRCRDCRACLRACPTQAMRVRDGRPHVLEHLCVDCAECIAACATGALSVRDEIRSLDHLAGKEDMVLVVPPGLLAECGPDFPPAQVYAALKELGFADVIVSAPFEQALREAALARASGSTGVTSGAQTAPNTGSGQATGPTEPDGPTHAAGPLILPACPAIVNLIELRFPSLVPLLAPFDSPWEAIQAALGDRPAAYVVSCPSQRSALLVQAEAGIASAERRSAVASAEHRPAAGASAGEAATGACSAEYLAPEVVRQAAMVLLTGTAAAKREEALEEAAPEVPGGAAQQAGALAHATPTITAAAISAGDQTITPGSTAPALTTADSQGLLAVTGMEHVVAVLEKIEDGLLDDVSAIEPYACEGGCFGSPLLSEDHHVAARRWKRAAAQVEALATERTAATVAAGTRPALAVEPVAVLRRRPFTARPGIRLDPDMGQAIKKLGRMQAVIRSLPGRDCGACGAPTCAALAEDIVMERADTALCPYIAEDSGAKEDHER